MSERRVICEAESWGRGPRPSVDVICPHCGAMIKMTDIDFFSLPDEQYESLECQIIDGSTIRLFMDVECPACEEFHVISMMIDCDIKVSVMQGSEWVPAMEVEAEEADE